MCLPEALTEPPLPERPSQPPAALHLFRFTSAARWRAAISSSEPLVANAISTMVCALGEGKPLLVCGNGGSACDAMHLTGELVGRFLLERRPLNAICLTSNSAVLTAWANDHSYDTVFSRQTEAYGQPGGVLLGISTSGTSKNVLAALQQARSMGMHTIALTGEGGGALAPLSDFLFAVPSRSTPLIQQAHLCLYHYFCREIERQLAGSAKEPRSTLLSAS